MTDLREAQGRGYLSKVPHYNSVFRYLEAEALTPYLYDLITTSSLPLTAFARPRSRSTRAARCAP